MQAVAYKTCIKCGVSLGRENTTWYRQKNYIHKCNACTMDEKREQSRIYRLRDPAGALEKARRHVAALRQNDPKKYSAQQMSTSAKKRARGLSLPCDIDAPYVLSLCGDKCPVLGVILKYGGGAKTKSSASLDRIDASGGYTRGNVQIISLLANLMKNEANTAELVAFSDWVRRTYQGGFHPIAS